MKPPCILGLKRFEKLGCPENFWDGKTGCSGWIEKTVITKEGVHEIIKQCVIFWFFKLLWDQCGLLEGNQQATESFRNGMLQQDVNGTVVPKSPPIFQLLNKNLGTFLQGIVSSSPSVIEMVVEKEKKDD